MKVTVLGCGDAFGSDGRSNTSFAINNKEEEYVLIDCGATTLVRLKQEGILLKDISTIIITHFHGDHYGGLPFLLISALFEQPRNESLTIVGPSGIKERLLTLQEAMYPGTTAKFSGLSLHFVEFEVGKAIKLGTKSIEAFEVAHSPESIPHGIKLHWENKVFAFSGDTSLTDSLLDIARDSDLFICECNYLNGSNFGHLSYEELTQIKDQFNAAQIWLSHMNEEVINSDLVKMNRLSDGLILHY